MSSRADIRVYGEAPRRVVVLHGGPGAPGYMAPVARELAERFGVIEPLQTARTLDAQVEELREQIASRGERPAVLVGSSWGAVLALLTAARDPGLAGKLVLVGSAVFDAESSRRVKATRLARTPPKRLAEIEELEREMDVARDEEKNRILARIVDLEFDPDVYDPLTRDLELIEVQRATNQGVWRDFVKLRDEPGRLRGIFSRVTCDVVNVHGDHDPHVIEGIQPFLKSCIPHIRLEWLEKCGHYPWIEKHARERFFAILRRECAQ